MRKLMWISIGFAAACALCAYVPEIQWYLPLAIGSGILFLLSLILKRRWRWMRCTAALLAGVMVGTVWFLIFQRYYLLPAIEADGEEVAATITATDYSFDTPYGTAVDGKVSLDGRKYKIRVYINDKIEIRPGESFEGIFRMRYTPTGGKEDATYHAGKGIFLLAYDRKGITVIPQVQPAVHYHGAELAHAIKIKLAQLLPEDVFAFAKALLLGDGSDLDYATEASFKVSGIRHIIAVSGLHVAVLYGVISIVTFRKRYITALLAVPVLLLFAAAAGFTPSVTRACIMVGLLILAQVFNRDYDSATALAFAAIVMLVRNPLVITSVSFQLSVGCVAGILLFQGKISDWMKSILGNSEGKGIRAKLKRGFISSVSVTLGAMSLATPLSAYYFGSVSLIGMATNLLMLWVVSFVFTGLVVLCVLGMASMKAAAWLGTFLAYPIRLILKVSKLMSGIPLAAVYTKSVYIVVWLAFIYVLLGVFIFSGRIRPRFLVGIGILSLCAALFLSWMEPLRDDVRMTVLDVGQGQSIILQSEGRTFLIDCGGDDDEMTADMAAETLLSQGVFRLDGIILTHGDRDHAGGVLNLLNRVSADMLLVSSTSDLVTSTNAISLTDGQVISVDQSYTITYGKTRITIFGPISAANTNENSLCVLFSRENCDILITGDRGYLGEKMLLRETELPQVDVLIAGHHGSKNATSEELLAAVRPEVVIISVGADNPYGHPSEEVLERLKEFDCKVYRTDEDGTIIFRR